MRSTGQCSIMDFSAALREVYEDNAAFWQTAHSDMADLSDVSRSSGNRSSLTSMLRSILAQSIKDALNAMDMYVLKAAKAFEALARGPKAKMLCSPHRPEPVQFGSYEPPTLP